MSALEQAARGSLVTGVTILKVLKNVQIWHIETWFSGEHDTDFRLTFGMEGPGGFSNLNDSMTL